jgi:hypothetical protein
MVTESKGHWKQEAAMSKISRRRRPIFNRRAAFPIIRVMILSVCFVGVGGVGFAAGVKVGAANPAPGAKEVRTVANWSASAAN